MKANKIIKVIVFLLIFLVGFSSVQTVLEEGEERSSQRVIGFFEERENSLDAVFLGSSATYAFWSAPIAFAEHGITVFPFSTSSQPTFASKYIIDDALKTQPDAVFIINISTLNNEVGKHFQKLLVDYPTTVNKLLMTDYICDLYDISLSDRMEYYFPIIRFHGRWNELKARDFSLPESEYKCGNLYKGFLSHEIEESDLIFDLNFDFEIRSELPESEVKGLTELMDYCEENNVKALFYISPQAAVPDRMGAQNTMIDMLEERGFNVLDLRRYVKDMGLDYETDFYNSGHTNIHGSIKVTDFISRYLIDNYGLKDKRGMEEYSDWTAAAAGYYEAASEYLLPEDYEYLKSLK